GTSSLADSVSCSATSERDPLSLHGALPILGLHQQGGAMAVLPVDQQILVAHQVNQGEDLGEQGDQQDQQQGAGKEAAGQQRVPAGAALHCCWPSGTNT